MAPYSAFFYAKSWPGRPYTVVGDGSQARDFTYVTDVAHAFFAAAETPRVGRVYNLGAGKPQSVNRLVELLGGEKIRIPKRPGEPDCTWADISRITSELDWRPQVSFEEGVGNSRRYRLLAQRAPLGSGVDRQSDKDLVPVSEPGALMVLPSLTEKYRHKIKTADELTRIIGPRPRAKKVIMCHVFDESASPGMLYVTLPCYAYSNVIASRPGMHTSNKPWHMMTFFARGRGPMILVSSSAVLILCRYFSVSDGNTISAPGSDTGTRSLSLCRSTRIPEGRAAPVVDIGEIFPTPSSKLTCGRQSSSEVIREMSAQVQSGSPGRFGMRIFSPPRSSTSRLTDCGLPAPRLYTRPTRGVSALRKKRGPRPSRK